MRSVKQLELCPVCGFPLEVYDFNICPSCGVEFGVDDIGHTHSELRKIWVENLALWSSSVDPRPVGWNPWLQLILAGHIFDVPFHGAVQPARSNIEFGQARLTPSPVLQSV